MSITAAQASWFRLRRSGLVEPYRSPSIAAGKLAGIQAQIHTAAGLALWNRVPSLTLDRFEMLLARRRTMVKLWGQRNTLHLYRTADWPLFAAAFRSKLTWLERALARSGDDDGPYHHMLREIDRRLSAGGTITRRDMNAMKIAPDSQWLTWGGVIMRLVRDGAVCHACGSGSETRFVHRKHWLPGLDWNPPEPKVAQREIVRRYLSAYGPATDRDLGFWLGLTMPEARAWIGYAEEDLVDVVVDGEVRIALRRDLTRLSEDPPSSAGWPVRLLFRFDPLLLGLKHKDWIVSPEHYKKVWRPAGHIEGVLLVREGVRGTWRYDRAASGLTVTMRPFSALPRGVLGTLRRQAAGVAEFFGLPLATVVVEPYSFAE